MIADKDLRKTQCLTYEDMRYIFRDLKMKQYDPAILLYKKEKLIWYEKGLFCELAGIARNTIKKFMTNYYVSLFDFSLKKSFYAIDSREAPLYSLVMTEKIMGIYFKIKETFIKSTSVASGPVLIKDLIKKNEFEYNKELSEIERAMRGIENNADTWTYDTLLLDEKEEQDKKNEIKIPEKKEPLVKTKDYRYGWDDEYDLYDSGYYYPNKKYGYGSDTVFATVKEKNAYDDLNSKKKKLSFCDAYAIAKCISGATLENMRFLRIMARRIKDGCFYYNEPVKKIIKKWLKGGD